MKPRNREIEWQLRRLEVLRRQRGGQIAMQAGLQRGRLPILEYLMCHEGSSQRALAEVLHVSPASIAVTIRRMEKDGLVRREADPTDQRANRLYITDEGRDRTRQCRARFDILDRRMFAGFTDEELSRLQALVQRMFNNLIDGEREDFHFPPSDMLAQLYDDKEETDA